MRRNSTKRAALPFLDRPEVMKLKEKNSYLVQVSAEIPGLRAFSHLFHPPAEQNRALSQPDNPVADMAMLLVRTS